MIKTTRNILTPNDVLHVYEEYEDGTSILVNTMCVKYVIMGYEFASVSNIHEVFGMPSDWTYKRIYRAWKSPRGFPATWRELVGQECFDCKVIAAAKRATWEAAKERIEARIPNGRMKKLTDIITRHRRLNKIFLPVAESFCG